ncbi:polysaccharide deacetylase family protein [Hasllibacter sp. MH4015]|uniref:polysaccharide deacetylase family protein n=1 Tax=Hasllibacter sp. MH4015 TaxID=2854029 RepID=UPI001CD319EF|nr:polysaccharide deacetylase family protein [Hasllibacter sp. MH4015]
MRTFLIAILCLALLVVGAYQLSRARSVQLFGEIVTRAETDRPVIALTFDDGPSARFTQPLLDALGDVPATFFLVGQDIVANPEAAQAIVDAGHEVGNHSWSHPRMILMSPAEIHREIEDTDAAIRALGYDGPIHFRPPFGKKLIVLPWVLSRMGRPTIMWSLEPETDLGPGASAADIAAHVITRAGAGDIVLLHGMFSGSAATRDALPEIVEGLAARGFEFVTVSEILGE